MRLFQSIRIKVWICVGVAFLGFLVATVSTFESNTRLSGDLTEIRNVTFPLALKGGEALNLFKKQVKSYEDAFLLGDEEAVKAGNALSVDIMERLSQLQDLSGNGGAGEGGNLHELAADYDRYARAAAKCYGRLANGEDLTGLQEDVRKVGMAQAQLLASFERLSKVAIAAVEDQIENAKIVAGKNTTVVLTLFLAVLLLSGLIINFIANRLLIKPLQSLQTMVRALSEGRYDKAVSLEIRSRDEIGELAQAMNEMAEKLKGMVQRLDGSSVALTGITGKIKETSLRVDEAARLQDQSVGKTSGAVDQINESTGKVGEGVERLNEVATESTSSVMELSASVEEVAANAESLASAVNEVSSAITEMTASIAQVAEGTHVLKEATDTSASSVAQLDTSIKQVELSARETARITETVRTDAEKGKFSVEAAIAGMNEIRRVSETTARTIGSLSEKAANIGSILSVIDEITAQTNLLALNAAIIAAQAGEHGKGFAVVADEIRELANRTNLSTREISAVIQGVQEETRQAVEAIARTERTIAEGEGLSVQSGEALSKIVAGVAGAAHRVDQIAGAMVEQAQGSKMIREAVESVAQMVDQTAIATREQSKGTAMIMAAAERMKDMTSQVRVSSREQSNVSKVIARSMEDISRMIQTIKTACGEQAHESKQIVTAVGEIRTSTNTNLESTGVLNEAVNQLSDQTAALEREMANFKASNKPSAVAVAPGRADMRVLPSVSAGRS